MNTIVCKNCNAPQVQFHFYESLPCYADLVRDTMAWTQGNTEISEVIFDKMNDMELCQPVRRGFYVLTGMRAMMLEGGKDFISEVLEEIKPTLVDILGAIIIFKNLLNEMVGADFDMDKSCRYISVKDLTGTSIWVSSSDGDKVYSSIKRAFDKDEHVVLSFERCSENIDAACFFSAAIGSLYGDFPDEKVNSLLHICDADDELMRTLKLAVENAKKYYANKDAYDEAWQNYKLEEGKL